MKKFELHGNAASLIFHEGTGEYRIATSSFLLAGCKPLLRLNGKEVSFGHWSVTEHTKNSMVASAKGNAGNWTLEFRFAAGDALTLRLSGCLKKVCDDVELLYFDGLKMGFFLAPGHSDGGICMTAGSYLFTGDTLLQGLRTVTKLYCGSKEKLGHTLDKIRELQGKGYLVCPGHGECFPLDGYDLSKALS